MTNRMQGYFLDQRQLDAIAPVLDRLVKGTIADSDYEAACMAALKEAGCPLGYDKCPHCDGTGSQSTGITESPTTQCRKCEGTGISSAMNKGLPKDE